MSTIPATLFRLALVCFGVWGLYLNYLSTGQITQLLSWYTIQSNVVAVIVAFVTVVMYFLNIKPTQRYYLIKGTIVVDIFLTFFVFHFLLRKLIHEMSPNYNLNAPTELTVHYIVPLGTVLDYFLFEERGHFEWKFLFVWIGTPLLYVPFCYTASALGFRWIIGTKTIKFPYFFFDYETHGWGLVCGCVFGLLIFFTIISSLLILFDSRFKSNKKKDHEE